VFPLVPGRTLLGLQVVHAADRIRRIAEAVPLLVAGGNCGAVRQDIAEGVIVGDRPGIRVIEGAGLGLVQTEAADDLPVLGRGDLELAGRAHPEGGEAKGDPVLSGKPAHDAFALSVCVRLLQRVAHVLRLGPGHRVRESLGVGVGLPYVVRPQAADQVVDGEPDVAGGPWVERSVLARAEAYPLPWEAASDWNCCKLAIGAEK